MTSADINFHPKLNLIHSMSGGSCTTRGDFNEIPEKEKKYLGVYKERLKLKTSCRKAAVVSNLPHVFGKFTIGEQQ